jgi:steroid delta-isomerase-like uncharacterized protein
MSKENEVLVRQFIDRYLNTGDESVLGDFLTPDCRLYCNAKCEASDVAGYDGLVSKFRAAFPDLDHTLDEILSADDAVAYRWTNRGTHAGEFEGIPPTGKRIEFTGTTIFRFRDGRIAEERTSVDLLALMGQLGVIPVPEDAVL